MDRSKHVWADLGPAAGNGLFDRRAFLKGGTAFAAGMTGYTLSSSATAQQLSDPPSSRAAGHLVEAYGTQSPFERDTARLLSNPNGEPRTQHGRTPHHRLNGSFTPNGLHFVISHSGSCAIQWSRA
jgi:sulfane dehydrogenase subunit SoxC